MNRHCWLSPPCRAHCTTAAPSLVAKPRSSSTLPLLRLTNMYHDWTSTVSAEARIALTRTMEPAMTATTPAAAQAPRRERIRWPRNVTVRLLATTGRSDRRLPPARRGTVDVGVRGACPCSPLAVALDRTTVSGPVGRKGCPHH